MGYSLKLLSGDNAPSSEARPVPGRPVAQKIYQQILDLQVGRWPDEDRRWRVLRDYYFNAIRDCGRKVELLLDALRNNGMDKSTS
jgi:arylsulfatase A-like enzyme